MTQFRITDKVDRITNIASEVKSPIRLEQELFRGKLVELPVIRLVNNLPIYRMMNGRTQVEQYQYLSETGHPVEFFERGEENISAQQAQHRILLKLAKDQKGPIYQELATVAIQSESLLLTSDGVVLNGNRRLAAMRELFERDARTYSSFSHVDATILPKEANELDLELLETDLQMAPDTKLEYSWVNRRLKLRRQAEIMKIPRDQIKATYRFNREEDINFELQQLALAEEYLEKYVGNPHAYNEVGQSEQLFKDLEKALRGKSGGEAEIRRLLGYMLAKEARNLGNRVYRYNPIFGQDFQKVMKRYAEDESIDSTAYSEDQASNDVSDDDDPLSDLSEVERNPYANFKSILEDQEKTKETAEKFIQVFESLKEEKKSEKTRQAALTIVQKANRELHNIDLTISDDNTYSRIKSQLISIISISESLKGQIDKLVSENSKRS